MLVSLETRVAGTWPELKLETYLVQSQESFKKENTWNGPINDESHFVE